MLAFFFNGFVFKLVDLTVTFYLANTVFFIERRDLFVVVFFERGSLGTEVISGSFHRIIVFLSSFVHFRSMTHLRFGFLLLMLLLLFNCLVA